MRILTVLALLFSLLGFGLAASPSSPPSATSANGLALLLEMQGPIGPASRDFILRGLEQARTRNAAAVILKLDTPGGLDSSMRDIIQAILASPVPVIGYIAPDGARAASAGTYILYACHVAAMAPATNLGAATPVQIGGLPFPTQPPRDERAREPAKEPAPKASPDKASPDKASPDKASPDREKPSATPQETPVKPVSDMDRKLVSDARAYIRALAQLRGRNVEWAEKAVTEAASLSAQDALQQNVIDLIATDIPDLLRQVDGRVVTVAGVQRMLAVQGLTVEIITPDLRNRLLAAIAHPMVAYILLLIGIYGLFFELSNPGTAIPGVLGGVCLLLALFAFQVLPVNYAGLALLLLGMAFMIAEAFAPSFGVLGLGGAAAFVVGSLLLWDETGPGYDVPLGLIVGFALASAVVLIGLATLMARQRRQRLIGGAEKLLGTVATVMPNDVDRIWIQGESWRVHADRPLHPGEPVRVIGRDGLILFVQPLDSEKGELP